MTACFSASAEAGTEDEMLIRGDIRAWSWAAEQIDQRRRNDQVLIRLCDGQESLWDTADICLGLDCKDDQEKRSENVFDILDIIHVSSYVWSSGRALYGADDSSVEPFVRDRLLRILQGQAASVIRGIRRMATGRKLCKQKREDAQTFATNSLLHAHVGERLLSWKPQLPGARRRRTRGALRSAEPFVFAKITRC